VIEVMGRYTGWIALEAGIAGGADITLIPEIPIKIEQVCDALRSRHRRGKSFSIMVLSEGSRIEGYSNIEELRRQRRVSQLSNVGELLAILIEEKTGYEARVSVLGHIQRGGTPTAYDRIIGTRFGFKAVELSLEEMFGRMVSITNNKISSVPIKDAVKKRKAIDKDLYELAKVLSV
jgi:6-phosphofructokinase 1